MADLALSTPTLGFERPGCTLRHEAGLGVGKIQSIGDAAALFEAIALERPAARSQTAAKGATCAWLAPGEWLLTGDQANIASALGRANVAGGDNVLAIDLTHARAAFLLGGAEARTALAALCPLDLWDRSFPTGTVARTLLGDTGMFLARLPDLDDAPQFRIVVDQTMAGYAARMLAGPQSRSIS